MLGVLTNTNGYPLVLPAKLVKTTNCSCNPSTSIVADPLHMKFQHTYISSESEGSCVQSQSLFQADTHTCLANNPAFLRERKEKVMRVGAETLQQGWKRTRSAFWIGFLSTMMLEDISWKVEVTHGRKSRWLYITLPPRTRVCLYSLLEDWFYFCSTFYNMICLNSRLTVRLIYVMQR